MKRSDATLFVTGALVSLILLSFSSAGASARQLFRGAIVMVPAGKSCPSGWATVTALNGQFPMGGTSSGSGGSQSHSHSVNSHSHTMSHSRSISSHTHSIPSHTHDAGTLDTEGAEAFGLQSGIYNEYYVEGTYSQGGSPHTHDVSGSTGTGGSGASGSGGGGTSGGASTSDTGSASSSTNLENHLPPYYRVRFCKSG